MNEVQTAQSTIYFIEPNVKWLRKYIKLYYIQQFHKEAYEHITYYPNFTSTLNFYNHSKLEWSGLSRTHSFTPNQKPIVLFVGKLNKSRELITKGAVQKISTVFKPLGFNHFIEGQASKFIQEHFAILENFGHSFTNLLTHLFHKNNPVEIRDSLDSFYEENYVSFPDIRMLTALKIAHAHQGKCKVQYLADQVRISRKTLLRLFKKHLSYSVEEYLNIVKFRYTLNTWSKLRATKLTDLAYQSGYYDQSDLIHQFKTKTGSSPKELFRQLTTLEQELFWNINLK